MDKRRHKYQVT